MLPMGAHSLWVISLGQCGREVARGVMPSSTTRGDLPLRELADEGLRQDAAALVVVRDAADARCLPCAEELDAIDHARHTLGAIGLRLHDYILWHGERCVSLRLTGRL